MVINGLRINTPFLRFGGAYIKFYNYLYVMRIIFDLRLDIILCVAFIWCVWWVFNRAHLRRSYHVCVHLTCVTESWMVISWVHSFDGCDECLIDWILDSYIMGAFIWWMWWMFNWLNLGRLYHWCIHLMDVMNV